MQFDLESGRWINRTDGSGVSGNRVEIVTAPKTDLWQRSYYGFRNNNAPALLFDGGDNYSFTARASFEYVGLYDQCGIIVYLDDQNWFKASVEYETDRFSRLGSVVTNRGYSDWATTDIDTPNVMWYRLSRRGPDFYIESSTDGENFRQMRIFHLHALGETTAEMGRMEPPAPATAPAPVGVYACSPVDSRFTASFSDISYQNCLWKAHGES